MSDSPVGVVDLRCTCPHRILLAKCGRDERTGEPWVHVKARVSGHVTEVIVHAGRCRIKCRACSRWYRVKIVEGAPRLTRETDASG